jgi:uncharacterized protein YihD (DUF1040 family)
MRDPKRIPEILNQISQCWNTYPDLRLGQLLLNVSAKYSKDLYYIEDEELVKLLRDFLQTYNKNGEN